jgi:hypothetical protein
MSELNIPDSRAYRHLKCGEETMVTGQSFEVVSNPMSSMERTQCSTCGAMFPISDFQWSDTGETLADYYARHSQSATDAQRFLCSKKFMIALALLGAFPAAVGCYYLVRNDDLLTKAICLFTGLAIGAFIGGTVFLKAFADPIKRKVCGVSDTRLLK